MKLRLHFVDLAEHTICQVQNPDIPRAGRGGAAHGGAGQDADGTVCPGDNRFCFAVQGSQGIVDDCPERLFGSTNKRTPS